MESPDWPNLFQNADRKIHVALAETPLQKFKTHTTPWLIECSDEEVYVVKGRHTGRSVITEHIVARLGKTMNAPVPDVALIHITQEFLDNNEGLEQYPLGYAYGSRFISGLVDSRVVEYTDEDENRERFALLAVLYGWMQAADHQFLYEKQPPHRVYSADHGYFFPGEVAWNLHYLATAPPAEIDRDICLHAGLSNTEIQVALSQLEGVTNQHIANAICTVPAAWGIMELEKHALARFLAERRDTLLKVS